MTYFDRVTEETPTKFWINNPTKADVKLAIANHSINCTTNPSFCSKLLQRDPDYIQGMVDRAIRETDDDDVAADLIY